MNDPHSEPIDPDPYKDLSHIYANPLGDDAGQDEHDRLNQEHPDVMDHFVRAFAPAAGIGAHPGKLKRPSRKTKETTP